MEIFQVKGGTPLPGVEGMESPEFCLSLWNIGISLFIPQTLSFIMLCYPRFRFLPNTEAKHCQTRKRNIAKHGSETLPKPEVCGIVMQEVGDGSIFGPVG
jgi:hypothetical protein